MTDTCQRLAELAVAADACEGLELEEMDERCLEVVAKDGGLGGAVYELAERYVRTAGERVGYARTENVDETLEDLVAEAVAQSGTVDRSEPAGVLVSPVGEQASGMPEATPLPQAADLACVARRAVELLEGRSSNCRAVECAVRVVDQRRLVSNSLGLSRAATHRHAMVRLSYIAVGEREMHNVFVRGYAPEADQVDLDELAGRALGIGEGSLDGGTIEGGSYPVVLSREVVCQMLVGFWQLFSGEKIATGQSWLSGRMGEQVGSDALTISAFSEARWGAPGCLSVDAQGVDRVSRDLVSAGRLVSALTNAEWAGELGLDGSLGDADRRDSLGRIVPNDMAVVPGCLCVAPGEDSLEALLAKMGEGVYITDISDIYHSFNLASGGISTPVRGVRVREGRLAEPLSALSITDNLKDLFKNVVACGNALSWCDLEDLNAYWCGVPDVYVSSMGLVGAVE